MNLRNPSNTKDLRALIARSADLDEAEAAALVAVLWAHGYRIAHAPCAECVGIHESYPLVRAYHHPICRAAAHCAHCHKDIESDGLVGGLCADCAYGPEAPA